MSLKEEKLNDFVVKAGGETKNKKVKKFPAHELFNREFFTALMIAPSMTGKTTTLKNILEKMCPVKKHKKYKVWLFVRTLHNDKTWKDIVKMLDSRGYEITFDTDLSTLPAMIEKINNPEENDYPFVKHIVILDDIADEARSKTVNILTKVGRHKCVVFISCQSITDINPSARKNAHVYMLFNRLNDQILEEVYNSARPAITFEKFQETYHHAMGDSKFHFLYYDKLKDEFRKNFNTLLKVSEE